jgi:hypothetical protein
MRWSSPPLPGRRVKSLCLLDQKNAVEIKESIGAEQLDALRCKSDASAATTKISGVSKSDGAGQIYVSVVLETVT